MKIFLLFFASVFVLNNTFAKVKDLTAEVDYIFDGDTFSANVILENGAGITARVRFMNIDTPEMSGDCKEERVAAMRSKERLAELLPKGAKVVLSKIKDDKYLGRINAYVAFPDGRDIGKIMIDEKFAVPYNGGKRRKWCK